MAKSLDRKVAEKIIAAMAGMEVNPVIVGSFLSFASEELQARLYLVSMKLLYNWAAKFDASEYTPGSEFEGVCINAKRIVEEFERKGGIPVD